MKIITKRKQQNIGQNHKPETLLKNDLFPSWKFH
jgi:hypothetical protein